MSRKCNQFGFPFSAYLVLMLICTAGIAGALSPAASSAQPQCANEAALQPFEQGEKVGFRNAQGTVVISPRYMHAECFLETGIAAVADKTGWAYIDGEGNVLLRPFVFDNAPDPFVEGVARFKKNGKMGFFDPRGRVVIDARFEWVEPFKNGQARFCAGCSRQREGEHWRMVGGKWGSIDKTGAIVRAPR